MPYTYSEGNLIEQTAVGIFKELKWTTTTLSASSLYAPCG